MNVELSLEELHLLSNLIWEKNSSIIKSYNDMSIETAPPSVHKLISMLDTVHDKITNAMNKTYEELYPKI